MFKAGSSFWIYALTKLHGGEVDKDQPLNGLARVVPKLRGSSVSKVSIKFTHVNFQL